jgi:hypothetical protein
MTIAEGTQKQIDTVGGFVRAVELTSNTFIAFYTSSASGTQARHVTITGGVMTLGAVLTIDATLTTANMMAATKLSSTKVLFAYAFFASGTHNAYVVSVSGTTLSLGAVNNLTDTNTIRFTSLDTLSSSAAIYHYSTNASSDGTVRILTVSGTTITENAAFSYDAGAAFNSYNGSVAALSSTKAVVVYADFNNSNRPTGQVLDIAGTVITGNTNYQLQTVASETNVYHRMWVSSLDSTRCVVAYNNSPTTTYAFAISEAATVLTAGALTTLQSGGLISNISVFALSSTRALVASYINNADIAAWEISISGTTVTEEDDFNISQGGVLDTWIVALSATEGAMLWEQSTEGISLSIANNNLTLSTIPKPASIDASGTFIYLALLQGGTPILTKISTALDADGTTVFNPGAGDNIGVECGRFSSDTVWVAGNFDGTNVIEKSEDGGSSFVVKDDGTIGDVRAFVMGPDSDEKLLVFDETNGDILETRDSGASWDSINASVTPEVNAIARLGKNVQESVFGNDGGASNSINYSVNSGDDLEDFQTGVYPNANATKVIVN